MRAWHLLWAEGFMRLSYCVDDADLKLGLDRIEAFLARL